MLGDCGAGLYERVVIVDPLLVVFSVVLCPLLSVPASPFIVQGGSPYKG
jgi:hypothetical protein